MYEYTLHTETITHRGRSFRVRHIADDSIGEPWKEFDCHGPVSDWTTRDKRPGELVLNSDRRSYRYYNYAEAVRIAKRDAWGTQGTPENATRGQRAALAARADYEYLRAWCNDEWQFVGVCVDLLDDDGNETGDSDSLWGIESDDGQYLTDTAIELADNIIATVSEREAAELATIEAAMQRTREHVRAWLREFRALRDTVAAGQFPTLCETARNNLQREILEMSNARRRARELRELLALGA
mgnify:CR=1 FL=1